MFYGICKNLKQRVNLTIQLTYCTIPVNVKAIVTKTIS